MSQGSFARVSIPPSAAPSYVYDARGDKTRVIQFRGADVMAASSLFFKGDGRVLVGPGGYEFENQ